MVKNEGNQIDTYTLCMSAFFNNTIFSDPVAALKRYKTSKTRGCENAVYKSIAKHIRLPNTQKYVIVTIMLTKIDSCTILISDLKSPQRN